MRGPVNGSSGDLMRVLGVDPGLTRCGLGVVDGLPAASRGWSRSMWSAPRPSRTRRGGCCARGGTGGLDRRPPSGRRSGRAGVHPAQRADGDGHGAGRRGGDAGGRPAPAAGHLHTPSEVKAAITGSGGADKAQVGAMVTRMLRLAEAPRPADAADALALAICQVWRGGQARLAAALEAAAARRPGAAGVGGLVIASVSGTVLAVGATWRGRGRRFRAARAVQPQHGRRPAGRAADDAGHLAGRPGGLAHPVRVRRRRRTGVLRAAADRQRRRARSSPRRRWPCSAPTRCARRSPPRTSCR